MVLAPLKRASVPFPGYPQVRQRCCYFLAAFHSNTRASAIRRASGKLAHTRKSSFSSDESCENRVTFPPLRFWLFELLALRAFLVYFSKSRRNALAFLLFRSIS